MSWEYRENIIEEQSDEYLYLFFLHLAKKWQLSYKK